MTTLGFDCDQDITPFLPRIVASGMQFFCGYALRMGAAQVRAVLAAGIDFVPIFETTATRALQGASAGSADGALMGIFLDSISAPARCAPQFTVDDDVPPEQLAAVVAYMQAAWAAARRRKGTYGSGAVLSAVKPDVPWLAGAMGWTGSADYKGWAILQGATFTEGARWRDRPRLIQRGMSANSRTWQGITWPDLGFAYDPEIAQVADFGQIPRGVAQPVPAPAPQPAPPPQPAPTLAVPPAIATILAAADFYAAVEDFQADHGLQVDGMIGPETLAALVKG
jgi:hypothetical protein